MILDPSSAMTKDEELSMHMVGVLKAENEAKRQ